MPSISKNPADSLRRASARIPADGLRRAYTVREAREMLGGMCQSHFYSRLINPGEIKTIRIGRRVLIPASEIDRILAGGSP